MKGFLRFMRGLAALALLLGVVGGTPFLLMWIGRLPSPGDFPGVLLAPDDGLVLTWLLSLAGWLAWGGFTLSVVLEGLALVRGRRLRVRVPGLSGPRGPAAVLLISIAAMLPLSAHAQPIADPALPANLPLTANTGAPIPAPDEAESPTPQDADGHRYIVQRGDDLWSLAEKFYGDGLAWSRIAEANPIITSPDVLDVGWELVLPGVPDPAPVASDSSDDNAQEADGSTKPNGRTSAISSEAVPSARPERAPLTDAPDEQPPSTAPAPSSASPTPVAQPTGPPVATERVAAGNVRVDDMSPVDQIAYATAGVSSLVAAALLAALATRRAVQLSARPEGRRIIHPRKSGFEVALGRGQDVGSLRGLDLALRALGRHYRETTEPLPALLSVLVAHDGIVLETDRLPGQVPAGFQLEGSSLRVGPAGQELLAARAGTLMSEASPFPALVCLGATPRGDVQLHDLETAGSLVVEGPVDVTGGVLNSLLLELTCSWWGRGQSVTVVGGDAELAEALDDPSVRVSDDLDGVLAELETEQAHRHPVRTDSHPRDLRIRPELEEAWRPRVMLVSGELTAGQRLRIKRLVRSHQLIVVTTDRELDGPRITASADLSRLGGGLPFRAQAMTPESRDQLLELLRATASRETTAAPWWSDAVPEPAHVPEDQDSPPRRAFPAEAIPTRARSEPVPSHGADTSPNTIVSLAARRAATKPEEPAMDAHEPVLHPSDVDHPTLLLLGPVELGGARGERPARAARQCLEYAAWLLEHPGATSRMMAAELDVAEGTRRSNMSRLRAWLGSTDDGERYLPEAYSGRIQLHPAVTSDWNQLQLLTIGGVNRVAEDNLRAVLQLVRGAPLADAAPGQWHWAEELRTDMSSLVRDAGFVLGERALDRGDLDLARWAVNRALVAAPEDELLLAARVRTEHRAGNNHEVERLALRLIRMARKLNIELADETISLLQEAMEGQRRRRLG